MYIKNIISQNYREKTAASGSVEPLCVRFSTGVEEQVRFKPSFALVRREYGVKNRSLQRFHPFIHCFCVCFVDLLPVLPILRTHHYCTISWNINDTDQQKFVWIITWYNTFGVPEVVPRKSTRHWIFFTFYLFVSACRYTEFWVSTLRFLSTSYSGVLMWVNLTDVCVLLC